MRHTARASHVWMRLRLPANRSCDGDRARRDQPASSPVVTHLPGSSDNDETSRTQVSLKWPNGLMRMPPLVSGSRVQIAQALVLVLPPVILLSKGNPSFSC